jgi:hypothetical protein
LQQFEACEMSRYAENTQVPVDRSKAEIERLLQRYNATEIASGWRSDKAMIQFRMNDRIVRFVLSLPALTDFTTTASGRTRRAGTGAVTHAWEQSCRQRWRALALTIKAKLESAESGIEEFETAFMGQIVMPNGRTIAEQILPTIAEAYETKKMPVALLDY